ncbi:MAG: MBL fold metallo-hydrolase [Dehalococcoidales bacterium]|nr:MBL fold metallo-hydrolase [Dehalococcoidales bacterium]
MKLANNLYMYPEQGMFDANTYVITGSPGIIIDPGNADFLESRLEAMREDRIDPRDIGIIVNTHLHLDHYGADEPFREVSGAKIYLHPVQKENYRLVVIDGTRLLGMEPVEFREDGILTGSVIRNDAVSLEMLPSPGHSPDCICFYDRENRVLICGDVIFEMNTGRTDLLGGSGDELRASIDNLARLDIELLLPGHMSIVSGRDRVMANFDFIRREIFPWL